MFGRTVGVAAVSWALGASALILPPGIAGANGDVPDLSLSVVDPKHQTITIPCSECAFSMSRENNAEEEAAEDEAFWISGGANDLVLDFSISEDGERLQLNGEDIYPPYFAQPGNYEARSRTYVKQVPHSQALDAETWSGSTPTATVEVTAYGIKEGEKQVLTPDADMLVPLVFQLFGVENVFMTLDPVELKLLKTGDGELLIMEVTSQDTDRSLRMSYPGLPPHVESPEAGLDFPPPPPPFHGRPWANGPHFANDKDCNVLPAPLCKLKNMLESKIDAAMGPPHFRKHGGCPGRKGQHGPPDLFPSAQEDRPKQHHGRPHHMRPHGRHHHGHHHGHFWRHHFLHAFAKGLVAVLIPVMAGITVGMSVSLLGLIVGRLIAYFWAQLVRGGRRGYASVAQDEVSVEAGDDKVQLAEMEAPPPVYEDAPAYEDLAKEER